MVSAPTHAPNIDPSKNPAAKVKRSAPTFKRDCVRFSAPLKTKRSPISSRIDAVLADSAPTAPFARQFAQTANTSWKLGRNG